MHTLLLLLFFSCATNQLSFSSNTNNNRRILHEPLVPLNTLSPSQQPEPQLHTPSTTPNPKYPFSTTTTTTTPTPTPNNSPFFPNYPSTPPPPSPPIFASFPANISSLILPHSPKPHSSNSKLLPVALSAVTCAVLALAVSGFIYFRRRNRRAGKILRQCNVENVTGSRKLRHAPSTSSEFLYKTVGNLQRIEEEGGGNSGSGGGLVTRKLDSPELRPLPPLGRKGSVVHSDDGSVTAEEEEEEFYSPRGSSLGGSGGTGSFSQRALSAISGENFAGRSAGLSCSSFSSSNSGSPDRCISIRLSPPTRKSPESARSPTLQLPPQEESVTPVLSPALSPIHNQSVQSSSTLCSSSSTSERASGEEGKHSIVTHSPLLSPLSLSPTRELEKTPDGELGAFDVVTFENGEPCEDLDTHACASSLSSSTSQEGILEKTPDGELGAFDVTFECEGLDTHACASSQERILEKTLDGAMDASDDVTFENGKPCDKSSSQERVLENNEDKSLSQERILENSEDKSSSQERVSEDNEDKSSSQERVLEDNEDKSSSQERVLENNADKSSLERVIEYNEDESSSQERVLENNEEKSSTSIQERGFEYHEEKSSTSPQRLSNVSNESRKSLSSSSSSAFSLPSSPEKEMMCHHVLDQSPRMSSVSDRFRLPGLSSLPLSPALLSSPETEREFSYSSRSYESTTVANCMPQRKHWEIPVLSTATRAAFGHSGTVEYAFDQIAVASATPPPVPQRKQWEIPVLSTPIAPSPPMPPPPPPLAPPQRQRKQWGVTAPSILVGQPISRPPELIPPSRPFVLQNTTKVSSVELPPSSQSLGEVEEALKPKLKPLHWDKVRATSDRDIVWNQLNSSSFKLNEEMIETLFVVNTPNPTPKDNTPCSVLPPTSQDERVLDPKKSQNIAILLRALNITMEEVCEALSEGSADTLGAELLESLSKMAPSKEEERKLKENKDDSPIKLGPAEKFLKAVLDVPFAFKRVEAMLYIVNFESEVDYLTNSFQTLEAACEELRNSRMFLKLLEAVLKTGNRMNVVTNHGDAQAFKLDTLLKLADVRGADGKTSLLHFVVQEIIRTEGATLSGTNQTTSSTSSEDIKCRRLGLQVVSSLSSELSNVKKAASMDSELLRSDVFKLSKGIANIAEVVQLIGVEGSDDEASKKFTESMKKFIRMAEEEIPKIQAQESVAVSLVKEITEYFHGNLAKEESHPFRIFMVVRDFLGVLDRVCKEVGMINERTMVSSAHKFPVPVNPMLPQPLPVFHGRQQHENSSDDDSPSP